MVTNQKQSKWSPWQRTAWPVDVTVKVRDVFLSIFFIDEIEKYFGDLTGRWLRGNWKNAVSVNCRHVSSVFGKNLIQLPFCAL